MSIVFMYMPIWLDVSMGVCVIEMFAYLLISASLAGALKEMLFFCFVFVL